MIYFVATPIGNLGDISKRAIDTLSSVDVIACEDTRVSLKLLNYLGINKKLVTYHKFNENNSSEGIINLHAQGKNIAIISDAGMPIISDPGYVLITKLKEQNIPYTIIPGANAGLCALILSGLDSTRFTFIGFIPEQSKDRKNLLKEIKDYKTTLIFYESPHNIKKDIKDLYEVLGSRRACIVNEITKMYEKTIDFTLGEELDFDPKGEYVLVVEGQKNLIDDNQNFSTRELVEYYISLGDSKNDAIKKVAKERNLPKNEVYQLFVNKD